MNLAELGLKIQSEEAEKAKVKLNEFAKAADAADKSVDNLGRNKGITQSSSANAKAISTLAPALGNSANMAKQLNYQIFDMAQSVPLLFQNTQYAVQNIGMQLGQVSQMLGPGVGLKGAITALGPAIASFVTNPINLAIIGLTAGAAAASALYDAISSDSSAQNALKAQEELIGRMAERYEEVRAALDSLNASPTLSQIALDTDDLRQRQTQLQSALADANSELLESLRLEANALTGLAEPLTETGQLYRDYQAAIRATAEEALNGSLSAEELVGKLIALRDAAPELNSSEAIQDLIDEARNAETGVLALAQGLDQVTASLNAVGQAAQNMRSISETLSVMRTEGIYAAATEGRSSPYLEQANALEKLAEAQKKANEEAAKKAARDAKQKTDFQAATESIRAEIETLRIEAESFGMSATAAAAYRREKELLAAATADGTSVSEQERASIHQDIQQYRLAHLEVQKLKNTEEERQRVINQTSSGLSGFLKDLKNGNTLMSSLNNLVSKMADSFIDLASRDLMTSIFGGGKSSGSTGLFSSLFSLFAANGAAFGAGGIQAFAKGGAFTNSIVNQPTLFKFANGTGMMGEAGPEAIMPLQRDSRGRLGVIAGMQGGGQQNVNVVTTSRVKVEFDQKTLEPAVRSISQEESIQVTGTAMRNLQDGLPDQIDARVAERQVRGA